MDAPNSRRAGWRRLTPRAGIRAQLVAAALLWLVGTSILLVRGVFYIIAPEEYERFGYGIALIGLVAVAIGLVKARLILIRYARKAVKRIRTRGHACFFGFFAPSSWLFILVMMGGGMLLRRTPLVDFWWGRTFLGILYVAVGTALAIADVVFWRAAVGPVEAARQRRRGQRRRGPGGPAGARSEAPPAEPARGDRSARRPPAVLTARVSAGPHGAINGTSPRRGEKSPRRLLMASAITWFQIPASDIARAKAFYETICGFELEPLDAGPGMEMWGFPADWQKGEIGGRGLPAKAPFPAPPAPPSS